jgi:sec-independent protein translocase protein TatA
MRNPEIWIGLIVLGFLLFGAKKMPDAARGLGRSMRIFKSEIKGMQEDGANPQQQGQIPTGYQQQPYQPQGQPVYQQQPAQPVYQQQPQGQPVYQQQPAYQAPAAAPIVEPAPADHREAQ